MQSLSGFREKIDQIDNEILRLFEKRMDVSAEIATFKQSQGLAIRDPQREMDKLEEIRNKVRSDLKPYACELYNELFRLSREYQCCVLENAQSNNAN